MEKRLTKIIRTDERQIKISERIRSKGSHNNKSCSNSQRKAHQIAQIRHLEPQKRQYTTNEVDLR